MFRDSWKVAFFSKIRRIHIVFNILSGDRRDFIVDGADTVQNIKSKLHAVGNAPRPDSFVLLYGGRMLDDKRTFFEQNVPEDAMVHVSKPFRGCGIFTFCRSSISDYPRVDVYEVSPHACAVSVSLLAQLQAKFFGPARRPLRPEHLITLSTATGQPVAGRCEWRHAEQTAVLEPELLLQPSQRYVAVVHEAAFHATDTDDGVPRPVYAWSFTTRESDGDECRVS